MKAVYFLFVFASLHLLALAQDSCKYCPGVMETCLGCKSYYVKKNTSEPYTGCCTGLYNNDEVTYFKNGLKTHFLEYDSAGNRTRAVYYSRSEWIRLDSLWDTLGHLYSVKKYGWWVLGHEKTRYYRQGKVVGTVKGKDRFHLLNVDVDKYRMHTKERDSLGNKKTNMLTWDRTKQSDHGFKSKGFRIYFRENGKACFRVKKTDYYYYHSGCIYY